MDAIAVLPVKRFDQAKQRLGEAVEPQRRPALIAAMAEDVLDELARCRRINAVLVVSSEPAIEELAGARGLETIADPGGLGHSGAAKLGVGRAVALGGGCAALLPGDCPLVDAAEIDGALERLEPESVAIIPDRHGTGTNGLLLAPPDGIDPSFGPGSFERHTEMARTAGLTPVPEPLPSLGLDLDTPGDLEELQTLLAADPSPAPRTAEVLA